jgi:hypothetical protein
MVVEDENDNNKILALPDRRPRARLGNLCLPKGSLLQPTLIGGMREWGKEVPRLNI